MAKYIILIGLAIVAIGVLLYFFPNIFKWIGRLPGDIRIEKENSRFYFPITSMILLSVLLSLIISLLKRFL